MIAVVMVVTGGGGGGDCGDCIGGDGGHHFDYLLHLIFLFTDSNFLT